LLFSKHADFISKKQKRYSLKGDGTIQKRTGANHMKNLKIIGKVAIFFGVASIIFAVVLAIINYYLIQITSSTAPTDYVLFLILSTILPYLFFAVLSLIIAFISRRVGKENLENEAILQAQPSELIA
jgi:cyanate permease